MARQERCAPADQRPGAYMLPEAHGVSFERGNS